MRWLTLVFVLVALPALAVAKPKVAVAPLDGDSDSKIADIVVNAADDHARVVRPEKVSKAMDNLSVTTLTGKGLRKLRTNLEVDVVIHGTIEKAGSKRRLDLTISGKGKNKASVELTFKSTKGLKKELSSLLRKKIEEAMGGDEDPADDDPPPKKHDDDEKPKKRDDDENPKKRDDDEKPKKHDDDDRRTKKRDDDEKPKRRVADSETSTRKRSDDDEDSPRRRRHRKVERNPLTQAALWLDIGGEVARRTLTWAGGGTTPPPRVGTAAAAARINGEVYPGAFDTLQGPAAGIGLYGEVGYTLGLSITVPGTSSSAPIKDGHYAIGARYRVAFGTSSIAFGASYWRRYYIADRSNLMMGVMLDMPDVDYTAIAPGVLARFAATPTVAAFVQADLPLIFKSGDIQSATSYGRGKVIGFDLRAGLQIALAPHYAVALAAEYDQVGISFEAGPNSKAMTRGVSGATDRTIAFTATLGIDY